MRRPGYLRNLGDTWIGAILTEKALADEAGMVLSDQRTKFISTRSGAAHPSAIARTVKTPSSARLSSPDFLLRHAKWYDLYRRKVLG